MAKNFEKAKQMNDGSAEPWRENGMEIERGMIERGAKI